MANSTPVNLDEIALDVECDFTYSPLIEVLKFLIQVVYLSLGLLLNSAVLWTICLRYRELYMSNSFFVFFSVDCFVNWVLLLTDGLAARFLIYMSPLCPLLAPFFSSPLVFFKFLMVLIHHFKICKSLLQSLLVFNRMTCVLMPVSHSSTWRKGLRYGVVYFVFLIPFTVDWNLVISRVYMQATYGGFWMSYYKKVSWASQSRFQLIFIIIALSFTFICTTITIVTLIKLPERIKELERSITNANAVISIGFTMVAIFQIYYSFFYTYSDPSSPVYGFSFITYDIINIGSPIVMLCVSGSLRKHTFSWKKQVGNSFFTIRSRINNMIGTIQAVQEHHAFR